MDHIITTARDCVIRVRRIDGDEDHVTVPKGTQLLNDVCTNFVLQKDGTYLYDTEPYQFMFKQFFYRDGIFDRRILRSSMTRFRSYTATLSVKYRDSFCENLDKANIFYQLTYNTLYTIKINRWTNIKLMKHYFPSVMKISPTRATMFYTKGMEKHVEITDSIIKKEAVVTVKFGSLLQHGSECVRLFILWTNANNEIVKKMKLCNVMEYRDRDKAKILENSFYMVYKICRILSPAMYGVCKRYPYELQRNDDTIAIEKFNEVLEIARPKPVKKVRFC